MRPFSSPPAPWFRRTSRRVPGRRRTLAAFLSVAVLGVVAAGCGSISTHASDVKGNITFGVLMPFTGASAPDGVQTLNGCLASTYAINQTGGILGHQAVCKEYDTRSDPVDTVPAAQQMLSTAQNLAAIYGPDSGVATAVTPLIEKGRVTMCSVAGDPYYDHQTSPYFYRLQPADDLSAEALVVYAKSAGYHNVAFVFTTDGSAQTNDPPMVRAARLLGLHVTTNQQFPADQSSYRSEVSTLLAGHPQAIITETDPQTTGTYFSELAQANGNLPIIATAEASYTAWQTAMKRAIGNSGMTRLVKTVQPVANPSGPGWTAYASFLKAAKGTDPGQFTTDLWARSQYDCGNLMALAMVKAHSFAPTVYNKYVSGFVQSGPGKTVVHTYAEGVRALRAGKAILYVGALGPIALNQFHSVDTRFAVEEWHKNGFTQTAYVPPGQIAAIALH